MFSEIPGELPERNKDGNKDIFIITDFFRNTRIFIVFISTEKESAQTYGVCPQPFQIQHPTKIAPTTIFRLIDAISIFFSTTENYTFPPPEGFS